MIGTPSRVRCAGVAILCAVIGFVAPAVAMAGKFNRQVSVGDPAPKWQGLRGVDGQLYSLTHWADAQAVVVVFYSNRCPVVTAYEARLKQLTKDFQARGVKFIAISVSHHPADGLEKMQQRAHERQLPYPYVHDAT